MADRVREKDCGKERENERWNECNQIERRGGGGDRKRETEEKREECSLFRSMNKTFPRRKYMLSFTNCSFG